MRFTREILSANSIDVTVSAVRIIHDSVNTFPFLVEHAGDVSVVKSLGPLQEIEKILVNRKTRFLQPGKECGFAEFQVQSSQPFRVILGSHLSEHVAGGNQGADQPLSGIAKREFLHADGDGGSADSVLDLPKLVTSKAKGRQEIPGVKTTAAHVDRRVLCSGAADVSAAFQVAGVMENRGGDCQFPIALFERRNDRVLPVGRQQISDRSRRLHRMIKVVECCITRLELRVFAVKQVERKGD